MTNLFFKKMKYQKKRDFVFYCWFQIFSFFFLAIFSYRRNQLENSVRIKMMIYFYCDLTHVAPWRDNHYWFPLVFFRTQEMHFWKKKREDFSRRRLATIVLVKMLAHSNLFCTDFCALSNGGQTSPFKILSLFICLYFYLFCLDKGLYLLHNFFLSWKH